MKPTTPSFAPPIVRYEAQKRWDKRWHVVGLNRFGNQVGNSFSAGTRAAAKEICDSHNIELAKPGTFKHYEGTDLTGVIVTRHGMAGRYNSITGERVE